MRVKETHANIKWRLVSDRLTGIDKNAVADGKREPGRRLAACSQSWCHIETGRISTGIGRPSGVATILDIELVRSNIGVLNPKGHAILEVSESASFLELFSHPIFTSTGVCQTQVMTPTLLREAWEWCQQ